MSESVAHTRLVGVIVQWVLDQHSSTPGFCLFCDCPPILETEKPSPIEGFFPDVCGVSTPPAKTLIGEAKTAFDLETKRSYNQFLAFLRFLAARPNPTFVIATPWRSVVTAKNIVKFAQRESRTEKVQVQILNDRDVQC